MQIACLNDPDHLCFNEGNKLTITADLLNSLGLLLDIAGAALLWLYGVPAPYTSDGTAIVETPDKTGTAKRYIQRSHIGFFLIILGFIFQLLSNFMC